MKQKILKIMAFLSFCFLPLNVFAYSDKVYAGGTNVGIKIQSEGILIVGFYKVNDEYNKGIETLRIGDMILKVNNINVNSITELIEIINENMVNDQVTLTIKRDDKTFEVDLTLKLINESYKTGLYVKDSLKGIGTISYIDPETKIYGALGHEILESSTSKRIEVREGNIYSSYVKDINKSSDGNPGGKNAIINDDDILGSIKENTKYGIYGDYSGKISNLKLYDVGNPKDVHEGKAKIHTVINGEKIEEFEINIDNISSNSDIKNIHFIITDEKLLNASGGIVQGMSGSPIIQDEKIIGAVTHVVIDNVKTGYGIFITTMLEEGEN